MRVRFQNELGRYDSVLYTLLTPSPDLYSRGFAATQKGELFSFATSLLYSIHLVGFNLGRGYNLRIELHFHGYRNVLSHGPIRYTLDQALYVFGYGNIRYDHHYVCKYIV